MCIFKHNTSFVFGGGTQCSQTRTLSFGNVFKSNLGFQTFLYGTIGNLYSSVLHRSTLKGANMIQFSVWQERPKTKTVIL